MNIQIYYLIYQCQCDINICNYCIYDYQTMKRYPGNRSCTLVPLTLTPVNIVRRLGP